MDASAFSWMTAGLEDGAKPHHNFHVFDVSLRTGLMRDATATIALEHLDSCRVSWGQVERVEGPDLEVLRPPLAFRDRKLALAEPQPLRVARQLDGKGFVDDVRPGDVVSIHWNWACDQLTPDTLSRLQRATRRSLEVANTTI